MFIVCKNNLDDILHEVFEKLLSNDKKNFKVTETRKGDNTEVFGALIELTNPRARLSRSQERGNIISPLGELLWYLSGQDSIEMIEYYIPAYGKYSDDGKTAGGAYGPRIFGHSSKGQVPLKNSPYRRVVSTLKKSSSSRNAVIQIFSNSDAEYKSFLGRKKLKRSEDVPCTSTLQFVVRENKLHLHVSMRSNDVYKGLLHDIFSFTMIQEILANEIGVGLGTYQHSVGSLHLYDEDRTQAEQYMKEGYFNHKPMPCMPNGNPWANIRKLLRAECKFREGKAYSPSSKTPDYWCDLIKILKLYRKFQDRKFQDGRLLSIKNDISSLDDVYQVFAMKYFNRSI